MVVASEETDYAFLRLSNFASRQKLLNDVLLKDLEVWHLIHTSIQARPLRNLLLAVFKEQALFTIISF